MNKNLIGKAMLTLSITAFVALVIWQALAFYSIHKGNCTTINTKGGFLVSMESKPCKLETQSS
ncbi:hypothetical protein J31TS6_61760 [Brevibacillus reuszeri]|uniref:hypothetical protein n=1 Tax=Brevibacillus reuszeri TaxID=54915 RepID=UPI001B04383B|nr:hypothetical protein [Brevibacillus reuszeri]GIO10148.1 hypothetical protein J31TS6_61760 [Brevibacillus reuszeri]